MAEESYNNGSASFKSLNGWTADGWRTRYDESSSQAYVFLYDPQGNLVQRQSPHAYAGSAGAYDEAFYEGYGALRQDVGVYPPAVPQYDPVGFGGQWGYYTDKETGLLCLTHRYYDPGTGKFLNRDPIGYAGGANLYGFCDDNPVNETDPSGLLPPIIPYNWLNPDSTPIDYAKIGAVASRILRFLRSGAISRNLKETFELGAENGTDLTQTTVAPGTLDSPNARASEEMEQEVERTQRPPVLGRIRTYDQPNIPGYDKHHMDPPLGRPALGYNKDYIVDINA